MTMQITVESWQEELFRPHRYKIIYGGRGSGKSWGVADALLLISCSRKCLIVCGREFQNSIQDSVHSLLCQRIEALNLTKSFEIIRDEIRNINSGSRFIFKGLRQNIDSIKSMAGITHLWIEEADILSVNSWRVIKPTIREENSEIWITMNPKNKTDILYQEFIANISPDNAYVVKVNYQDNPYFPNVLADEMQKDLVRDYGLYKHIWEGECLEHSAAQVFHRDPKLWYVEEFEEPEKVYCYYGLDFGSVDPTAAMRCYIVDNILYITHEFYKVGVEIDDIGKSCELAIPGFRQGKIIADSARPETISFMKRQGYNVVGADKGKGSVEDGIAFIRSFDKVIIHPRCKNTINEFNLYSYKVDQRSGDITTDIVDRYNHICDCGRYALERIMKRNHADYRVLSRM